MSSKVHLDTNRITHIFTPATSLEYMHKKRVKAPPSTHDPLHTFYCKHNEMICKETT